MTAQQPHAQDTTADNNESERDLPLDTRRCDREVCANCMSESTNPIKTDTAYANKAEGKVVLDWLRDTIQDLWEELKGQPLDTILSNLVGQSQDDLGSLIERCFPDRLDSQQVMDLWDGTLDPRKPEVVAGLRLHRFLPATLGDTDTIAKTISERYQYDPNFFIGRENANMQFGWDLRAFDLGFCEADGEEDFLVQLHPIFRIHTVGTNGKILHRPGVYTFERAMCVLQSQEIIYRGLVRLIKCLAVPHATQSKKNGIDPGTALSTWQQHLLHAAGLVEAKVKTIKDGLSQLKTAPGRMMAEVKYHGACFDQAHGCEEPLNALTVCCHLSVRRHERLILFGALSRDLHGLSGRVTQYVHNSAELVHTALEIVERDCVWILKELVVAGMTDTIIDNADFVATMAIRDHLSVLPPDFWQALRGAHPLEWHILRLCLGQGDLPTLIMLLVRYIADHPAQFHARVSIVVEDLQLIGDVLVAAESLHPSSRNRFHEDDKPQGSVRACVEITRKFESLQLLAIDMTPPQGRRQEVALQGMMSFTTLSISRLVSDFAGIPNSLRTKLVALLGDGVSSGSVQDTLSLTNQLQRVSVAEITSERSGTRKFDSILNPTKGALVPSVATRTKSSLRVPGRLDEPLAGTTSQEFRQAISHLLAQPEKGTKLHDSQEHTPKQKRHGVAATDAEEEGPANGSAPQSPVLGPTEPQKLIFTDRRLYNTLSEIMPASTEGGRPGNVDLYDIRRLLTSPPLNFEEAVRGNTYVYSRLAQDGLKAGSISFHGPHAGNSLDMHVLNGVRADLRRVFSSTRETFELEEAEGRD